MADIDNLKGGTKRTVDEESLDNLRGGTKRTIQVNSIDNSKGGVKRVYVVGGGGGSPVIDPLNVTPSTSAQTITASGGVDGYSPVNVSAVDSSIDANITAGNIKKDVSILGVTGTYEGATPTGTMYIISNGTYNVADKAIANVNVPTTAPAYYIEKTKDANGKAGSSSYLMDISTFTDVGDYVFNYVYYRNTGITGTVDFGSLTTVSGAAGCYYMFQACTGLTSANLSSLTTVSGNNACGYMFSSCQGLTSIDISALTTVSGNNACQYMFQGCTGLTSVNLSSLTAVSAMTACQYMFQSCTGITSADLSSLTTLSGTQACAYMFSNCQGLTNVDISALTTVSGSQACQSMFYNCTGLTGVDLSSLTTVSGSQACSYMFGKCTSLATVYIGGTTAIDFGSNTNQFANMFSGCTQNIDVYAPAANQAQIEAFSGYPNFGGTGTVTWHWRS